MPLLGLRRSLDDIGLPEAPPLAARPEKDLRELADCATAAMPREMHATDLQHFRHGIADGHWEADDSQQCHVGKIVTDEGAFFWRDAVSLEDAAKGRELERALILGEVVDFEFGGSQPNAFRYASRENRDAYSRFAQKMNSQPVLDVVALEFERCTVDGAKVNAAVGEHAIDIDPDESY